MTSRQLDLFVAAREYDLPPRWDGWAVAWSGWTSGPGHVFVCPPPRERSVCPACGSIEPRISNRGDVSTELRVTPEQLVERLANYDRAGQPRGKVALFRLRAFRCVVCRHDQVWDADRDEWWDLDPTDYGADGSLDPDGRW